MCYQEFGPKGSDQWGKHSLSLNEMEQAITSASQIDELQKRFHLAGGEAFMKLGDCIRLFDHARAAGFADLTTTTNAFWARSDSRAREIIKELRSVGLSAIELSWDVWHAPYVHVDAIIHCIKSSFDAGIRTNLRILTTKSHPAGEALAMLPDTALAMVDELTIGPVFPTGRAQREIELGRVLA